MMDDIVQLTEQIHKFVRDQLTWDDSLKLLDEIVESREWMEYLEMERVIYWMAKSKCLIIDENQAV